MRKNTFHAMGIHKSNGYSAKQRIKLEKENKILAEENEAMRFSLKTYRHEMQNPIGALQGFVEILKDLTNPSEHKLLDHINSISKRGLTLLDLTKVLSISPEEIKKAYSKINPSILKNEMIIPYEFSMEENKIGVNFCYNNFGFYSHKASILAGLGTAFGNGLDHSKGLINIGIADTGKNIESLIESIPGSSQKTIYGLSEGMGADILNRTMRNIGGKIEHYEKPQVDFQNYQHVEKIGYQETEPISPDSKVWGVKLIIPKGSSGLEVLE